MRRLDAARLVMRMVMMIVVIVRMGMTMTMIVAVVMIGATEQPGAGDVHGEAESRNRDRLGKMDRHRLENATHRLVADQQRDHRKDDGAGETSEIAELAGAEG